MARHTGPVTEIAFSSNGSLLASAGADGMVQLWDPKSRTHVGEIRTGHTGGVSKIVFSRTGQILATAGFDDRTVRLWDPTSRRRVGEIDTGYTGGPSEIVFSPTGQILATASFDDGTVRLWDPITRKPMVTPFAGHTGQMDGATAMAFSPDGLLAIARANGRVGLSAAPTSWSAQACERVGRNLTASEWDRYVGQGSYVRHCGQYPPGQGADPGAPVATYPQPLGR
jgi:WD40 repeat protein